MNIKNKTLEVRITEELDVELKRVAKAQGRTESEIVRGAIEEYIRLYESRKGDAQ